MVLYNLEYITKNRVVYNCKILCLNRDCLQNEITDISSIVGGLKVVSIQEINNDIHRISKTIREKMIFQSTTGKSSKHKTGRPRKYII